MLSATGTYLESAVADRLFCAIGDWNVYWDGLSLQVA